MPSSVFTAWHPCHQTRHRMRVECWTRARPEFCAWVRGRGWTVRPNDRVDVQIGRAHASWTPLTGRCRLPGHVCVFKCHDAVQFAALLTYASKRLAWQERHGEVPWVSHRPWSAMEMGPFDPPWSPVDRGDA